MARIRSIKPSFFRSEDVTALSYRARLTWIGLWLYADDEGRLRDDARFVKGDLWALEDDVTWQEVEADLQQLAAHDRIIRYEVAGKRFIQIRKWTEHQAVPKATVSKLPAPPNEPGLSTTEPLPDDSGSAPTLLPLGDGSGEGSGSGDGDRKEEGGTARGAAVIPDRFDEFWSAYPRRVDKPAAVRAWAKAITRAPVDAIIAGARRHAADPNRVDQYTKHPGPWLNADAWNNPPLPDRNAGGRESSLSRRDRQVAEMFASLAELGDTDPSSLDQKALER